MGIMTTIAVRRRARLGLLCACALCAGCTSYPTNSPAVGILDPLERSYWNEGTVEIPAPLVGIWSPLRSDDPNDRDWFVFHSRGLYRRIRAGRVVLEEGGLRKKDDLLFLHVQLLRGSRYLAPNFFRFRYEILGTELHLRFLAASSRGDSADDAYQPRIHRLVRAAELPPGTPAEWADTGPITPAMFAAISGRSAE